ncbi:MULTISPECIES: ankyrin repeat domain-containing protein [unclassified Leucobacter]|uniref:ankyrin repeat domain-containing protein n=1 Tax=unclassified Leucobacter TaxID=2621730 RepID=UPI00165DDE9C|nr:MULTISPECIES: ankyrin repeat domain-containing protein [unclassified Leucobacter]MBC9937578.1 ankyrin repeat domain-containing protein [Leucobacter sp. cx-87]
MNTSTRRRWPALLLLALPLALSACAAEPAATEPTQVAPPAPTAPTPLPAPKPTEVPPELPQAELDARLRAAAWANDVDAARKLIEQGADVNAKDDTVQSAYLIATSEGRLELLRLTLAHGANVHDLDSWVGTGLIRAAERGHWDVVGELIQAGTPLDHVNRIGYQAIHEAVWLGRDDPTYHATVRVLVAGGVQFQAPSGFEGLTPLQMAYSKGYPTQAALLEALAATPLPADPVPALLAAAAAGDANGVALALRAGAPADSVDTQGRSALEIAEHAGHAGHLASAQVIRALGG